MILRNGGAGEKPRYMIFDMTAIPDRYYSFYEECVNMKPEIDLRSQCVWLWKLKGGFWYD